MNQSNSGIIMPVDYVRFAGKKPVVIEQLLKIIHPSPVSLMKRLVRDLAFLHAAKMPYLYVNANNLGYILDPSIYDHFYIQHHRLENSAGAIGRDDANLDQCFFVKIPISIGRVTAQAGTCTLSSLSSTVEFIVAFDGGDEIEIKQLDRPYECSRKNFTFRLTVVKRDVDPENEPQIFLLTEQKIILDDQERRAKMMSATSTAPSYFYLKVEFTVNDAAYSALIHAPDISIACRQNMQGAGLNSTSAGSMIAIDQQIIGTISWISEQNVGELAFFTEHICRKMGNMPIWWAPNEKEYADRQQYHFYHSEQYVAPAEKGHPLAYFTFRRSQLNLWNLLIGDYVVKRSEKLNSADENSEVQISTIKDISDPDYDSGIDQPGKFRFAQSCSVKNWSEVASFSDLKKLFSYMTEETAFAINSIAVWPSIGTVYPSIDHPSYAEDVFEEAFRSFMGDLKSGSTDAQRISDIFDGYFSACSAEFDNQIFSIDDKIAIVKKLIVGIKYWKELQGDEVASRKSEEDETTMKMNLFASATDYFSSMPGNIASKCYTITPFLIYDVCDYRAFRSKTLDQGHSLNALYIGSTNLPLVQKCFERSMHEPSYYEKALNLYLGDSRPNYYVSLLQQSSEKSQTSRLCGRVDFNLSTYEGCSAYGLTYIAMRNFSGSVHNNARVTLWPSAPKSPANVLFEDLLNSIGAFNQNVLRAVRIDDDDEKLVLKTSAEHFGNYHSVLVSDVNGGYILDRVPDKDPRYTYTWNPNYSQITPFYEYLKQTLITYINRIWKTHSGLDNIRATNVTSLPMMVYKKNVPTPGSNAYEERVYKIIMPLTSRDAGIDLGRRNGSKITLEFYSDVIALIKLAVYSFEQKPYGGATHSDIGIGFDHNMHLERDHVENAHLIPGLEMFKTPEESSRFASRIFDTVITSKTEKKTIKGHVVDRRVIGRVESWLDKLTEEILLNKRPFVFAFVDIFFTLPTVVSQLDDLSRNIRDLCDAYENRIVPRSKTAFDLILKIDETFHALVTASRDYMTQFKELAKAHEVDRTGHLFLGTINRAITRLNIDVARVQLCMKYYVFSKLEKLRKTLMLDANSSEANVQQVNADWKRISRNYTNGAKSFSRLLAKDAGIKKFSIEEVIGETGQPVSEEEAVFMVEPSVVKYIAEFLSNIEGVFAIGNDEIRKAKYLANLTNVYSWRNPHRGAQASIKMIQTSVDSFLYYNYDVREPIFAIKQSALTLMTLPITGTHGDAIVNGNRVLTLADRLITGNWKEDEDRGKIDMFMECVHRHVLDVEEGCLIPPKEGRNYSAWRKKVYSAAKMERTSSDLRVFFDSTSIETPALMDTKNYCQMLRTSEGNGAFYHGELMDTILKCLCAVMSNPVEFGNYSLHELIPAHGAMLLDFDLEGASRMFIRLQEAISSVNTVEHLSYAEFLAKGVCERIKNDRGAFAIIQNAAKTMGDVIFDIHEHNLEVQGLRHGNLHDFVTSWNKRDNGNVTFLIPVPGPGTLTERYANWIGILSAIEQSDVYTYEERHLEDMFTSLLYDSVFGGRGLTSFMYLDMISRGNLVGFDIRSEII